MSRILVLFTFLSIGFFNFYSDDLVSKDFAIVTPTATKTPIYCPPPIITLEKNLLTSSGFTRNSSSENESVTRVLVTTVHPENKELSYRYIVSGGQIIGDGAEVIWDLTGGQPGTYEIKVEVKDKKSGKLLQSATKTVTVEPGNDDGDRCLLCPNISVNASTSSLQAGETIIFTANFSGREIESLTYKWTISDGKIIEGQGTSVIKVSTNSEMAGKTVEATVKFNFDCSEICNSTASASGSVKPEKR